MGPIGPDIVGRLRLGLDSNLAVVGRRVPMWPLTSSSAWIVSIVVGLKTVNTLPADD